VLDIKPLTTTPTSAGVAGLTTALLLSKLGHSVAVVAKHMPGDYDIEYTSPWAGANYLPYGHTPPFPPCNCPVPSAKYNSVSAPGTREAEWERITFAELHRLTAQVPEAGIHFQDAVIYKREKDSRSVSADWFSELLKERPWFAGSVPEVQLQFRAVPLPT